MSPSRLAKIESAIRLALEFNKAFNKHDIAGMMQLVSDDCIFENSSPAPDGASYSGKEAVTRFLEGFFRESPQARVEIEDIFGLGLRCIMCWRYEWKDSSGNTGHVRGIDIFQVKDELIFQKLSYVKG